MRTAGITLLCTWLAAAACWAATAGGAPAPATAAPAPRYDAEIGKDAYDWAEWSKFWAFQPVRKPTPPTVSGAAWGRNEIDAFVLAKLSENGMAPSAEADKLTLVRRAAFDLTGLPPTPEEVRAFVADR